MKPTLKDVARLSGVSAATVSRILKSPEGFHPETRQKVLQAIHQLGYVPLHPAEKMVPHRQQALGLVFPKVSSMLISQVLLGVQEKASQAGCTVMVCHTDGTVQGTLPCLQLFTEQRVLGVIFASEVLHREYHDLLQEANIPVVLLSSVSYQFPVPFVRCDDRSAACAATRYLLERGHRDIAIIAGARSDPFSSTARVKGYLDAHQERGLIPPEQHIVYTRGFSFQDGREGFEVLLQRGTRVSAVFACSDEMAAGVLAVAAQRGIRVPEQLSVMGYDDLPLTEMTWPPLTTLRQPFEDMGRKAVQLLLDCLQDPELARGVLLPFEIIERQSVRSFG